MQPGKPHYQQDAHDGCYENKKGTDSPLATIRPLNSVLMTLTIDRFPTYGWGRLKQNIPTGNEESTSTMDVAGVLEAILFGDSNPPEGNKYEVAYLTSVEDTKQKIRVSQDIQQISEERLWKKVYVIPSDSCKTNSWKFLEEENSTIKYPYFPGSKLVYLVICY